MKVYLVAEQGGTTAFKITTAHVYSNVEDVIRERLHNIMNKHRRASSGTIKEKLLYMGELNVYYAELDNANVKAKKFKDADWKIAAKEFIKKYPGEISKAEEDREKINK